MLHISRLDAAWFQITDGFRKCSLTSFPLPRLHEYKQLPWAKLPRDGER